MSYEEMTNEELAVLAQQGDDKAFNTLYIKIENLIHFYLQKHIRISHTLYEEFFGECVIGFIKGIKDYNPAVAKVTTFLHTNVFYSYSVYLKKLSTVKRIDQTKLVSLDSILRSTKEGNDLSFYSCIAAPQNKINEELEEAINNLPQLQKEIVEDYYFIGLNQQEIAVKRNITQTCVCRRLKQALENLKAV